MVHPGGQLGLPTETLDTGGVLGQVGMEDLERDQPL